MSVSKLLGLSSGCLEELAFKNHSNFNWTELRSVGAVGHIHRQLYLSSDQTKANGQLGAEPIIKNLSGWVKATRSKSF